ncbi:MAG TPA: hypothetical protein PKI05_03690 [Thermogutta sp.]|nr:hypothetical protein [Thermogutta sp.]
MDRIWECWVADWLNAVEREHGMGDRAIDMLDGLEIDLPLQQAAAPEERRFFELLRQSQESLLEGDFQKALAYGLTAAKVQVASWQAPAWEKPDLGALSQSGVSDEQICWILGWKDEHGNPALEKLREERRRPGLHLDRWQPPVVKEFEERKEAMLKRIEALRKRLGLRFADEVVVVPLPGVSKKTWELLQAFGKLQRLGWSIRKIARHLGLSYAKTLKLRDQWEAVYGKASQSGTDRAGGGVVAEGVDDQSDSAGVELSPQDDFGVGQEVAGAVASGGFDSPGGDCGPVAAVEGGGLEGGASASGRPAADCLDD